jgi:3-oxoacyl-[acyl-carrier-protein] synthase III
MRFGLRSIGVELPEEQLDNGARCAELQTDLDFLDAKIGTRVVRRMPAGTDTADLAEPACRQALQQAELDARSVEVLVVCTQNPHQGGIPHTSAILHERLGLAANCACFDISLGCSGYVYGLSILEGFLERNGFERGVLVTADPYSKIIDPLDRNTAILFGDAATATVLVPDSEGRWLGAEKYLFATRGRDGEAICNRVGKLAMNGRAVFEFALKAVPEQIRAVARAAGWDLSEVDRILLHQGSKFMVEQLGKLLRATTEQVPVRLAGVGNTVSSSIPLLLADEIDNPRVQRVIVSGFGVGLSWASAALSRNSEG